ncbi:MAG TPA: sn-glycerol-3-phosphate ABC transporter ATP-binding protein UgpC [Chloroflexota bacterium]|jgi:multiple sugar transport system ATP-binding protein|nr:sn-glycerol-3-phosphate ABC transporter ATP-binding protein UgpC [Chloroflexota bacterium]
MARVKLERVTKVFSDRSRGEVVAVKEATLEIGDGQFLVLLGPSGCGKTTTLRMIAGLEKQTAGDIYIGDRLVNKLHPKERDIAMVFQDYALYPHMTVYDNMSFGLRNLRVPRKEIEAKVAAAAEMLGIGVLLNRRPRELSGGQRQRVAVGRAIVRSPKVFLFDEPLSNLDAKLRVAMRVELAELHQRLGATMVYVTHDQVEAMTLGQRIVVMNHGVIQQVADPRTLYDAPVNLFVAGFVGAPAMNIIWGRLERAEGLKFAGDDFAIDLPEEIGRRYGRHVGQPVVLGVRPEDLQEAEASPNGQLAQFRAPIKVVEYLGSEALLYFDLGGRTYTARVDPHTTARPGEVLEFRFGFRRTAFFHHETQERLMPQ